VPASNKITVHDAEIDREYLEANVAECLGADWQRARWTAAAATPVHSASGDSPQDHSHCQICWWTLSDSADPAQSVGYTDGERWICSECYDRFIADATSNA
jgi:hypothetical protein